MNRFVRISAILAGLTGAVAATSGVQAADIFRDSSVRTNVEYGSGWYLRGHVGYASTSGGNLSYFSDQRYDYDNQEFDHGVYSLGIGAGYTFNQYLRMDFTMDYISTQDWSGETFGTSCGTGINNGDCYSENDAEMELTNYSVNAYVSLGRYHGFSPYVGAGVGLADVKWSSYEARGVCVVDPGENCTYGDHSGGAGRETYYGPTQGYDATSSTVMTYSLIAGVDYRINENWLFDMEYKYTQVSDGVVLNRRSNNLQGSSDFDAFGLHDFRVGLRYEIW